MKFFHKPWIWGWIFLFFTMFIGCHQLELLIGQPVQEKIKKKVLFNGESMEGWKIVDWTHGGEVEVDDGRLVLGQGHQGTGVTWHGEFPEVSYEVSLDAMRMKGSDFFCGMTFPVGNEFCTLVVGGWGGSLVGLSNIDGFDASENTTTTHRQFENNQWYRIRLRVNEKRIEAWIDQEKVVDFSTKNHRLSLRMETLWSKPFGLLTWRTRGAFRNIRVRYPLKNIDNK
jgi:hypothetical protein